MTYVWIAEHLDIACEDKHLVGIFTNWFKAKEALREAGHPDVKPWKVVLDTVTLEDDN